VPVAHEVLPSHRMLLRLQVRLAVLPSHRLLVRSAVLPSHQLLARLAVLPSHQCRHLPRFLVEEAPEGAEEAEGPPAVPGAQDDSA